jgi:hypothetical protein
MPPQSRKNVSLRPVTPTPASPNRIDHGRPSRRPQRAPPYHRRSPLLRRAAVSAAPLCSRPPPRSSIRARPMRLRPPEPLQLRSHARQDLSPRRRQAAVPAAVPNLLKMPRRSGRPPSAGQDRSFCSPRSGPTSKLAWKMPCPSRPAQLICGADQINGKKRAERFQLPLRSWRRYEKRDRRSFGKPGCSRTRP